MIADHLNPTHPLGHSILTEITSNENAFVVYTDIFGSGHMFLPEIGRAMVAQNSVLTASSRHLQVRGDENDGFERRATSRVASKVIPP